MLLWNSRIRSSALPEVRRGLVLFHGRIGEAPLLAERRCMVYDITELFLYRNYYRLVLVRYLRKPPREFFTPSITEYASKSSFASSFSGRRSRRFESEYVDGSAGSSDFLVIRSKGRMLGQWAVESNLLPESQRASR